MIPAEWRLFRGCWDRWEGKEQLCKGMLEHQFLLDLQTLPSCFFRMALSRLQSWEGRWNSRRLPL